jgi:S-adenosylmethionine:tRNA ribosyltransferase-isomerase
VPSIRVDAFDFELPEDLIALRPAVPRDASRLLVVREDGSREHKTMRDLPELLSPGDALVVNDTKVIAARLKGMRMPRGEGAPGAKIEILLLKQIAPNAFRALARPAKRLKQGDRIRFRDLAADVRALGDRGEVELAFDRGDTELLRAIDKEGEMPLPPYIAGKRAADARDTIDYQTAYARLPGSVAAPTAGLHFTPDLLERLAQRGIARHAVTLHVGAGTFLPVTAEDTKDHRMHPEEAVLAAETASALNAVRAAKGRIVAAGSTALRTLETAADDAGVIHPFAGETALFITPGYRFKAVDALLTNFHLPRSTLFMLVCAFAGTETMKAAYAEAIANRYRFYSYGDACLLFRARQ